MPRKSGIKGITYSSKVAESVCMKIMEGKTLAEITKSSKMPHKDTIKRWMLKYPEFRKMVTEARNMMGLEFGDRVAQLAKQVEDGKIDPYQAKVAMSGYKWSASKLAPHVYGDKPADKCDSGEPKVCIQLPHDGRDELDDATIVSGDDSLPKSEEG